MTLQTPVPHRISDGGDRILAPHRSRAHHSAHAETGPSGEEQAAQSPHPLVAGGSARLISTQEGLQELIGHLRAAGSFAYDSEFIGELTYFPKLCLIQTASTTDVALIDPLANLSLKPFWELLADPKIEKIVHAGQQDIEPVIRHLGVPAAGIFDTQLAAGFTGLPYPLSLSKLVMEITGARLGKGLTFTHWDQRPLSAVQLRYAADDVRYLPRIRAELGQRLKALGHSDWVREECDALCDTRLYRFDPDTQYQRVRGASGLQPRNLAVLRELTVWRDAAARAHDLPPRSFLKDEILTDLARNPVKTADRLDRVRGLPRPVELQHGADIVEATARALSLAQDQLPKLRDPEQSPNDRFQSEALWAAGQCLCTGQAIDPALVTNRQEMGDFHRLLLSGKASDHPLMNGWRKAAIGEPLMKLMNGKSELRLRWKQARVEAELLNG